MGPIALVVARRLARGWPAIVASGVLLGIGFGLCLASFAAARRTATAYDRALVVAEAPDAAIGFGPATAQNRAALERIEGVTAQRLYAGYVGTAEGVDPVLTTALLAPTQDRFPLELPRLTAGRMPDPDAVDEVFVNTTAAERGDLDVGQRLDFQLVDPLSDATADQVAEIVGIGTFPAEELADDTLVVGVFVFTHAFYEAYPELAAYAVSNVDLAPGFDARRDLAPRIASLGFGMQSARSQEREAVSEALRPIIIVLVALGVVAFVATIVAASQVVQRKRDGVRADDGRLRTLGMTENQIRGTELATSGVMAAVAIVAAFVTMLVVSPVAPIGPLHDMDPTQGYGIDLTVAAVGIGLIVVTLAGLTLVFSSVRRRSRRPASPRAQWLAHLPARVTALTGLSFVLRPDERGGRVHGRRAIAATVGATAIVAMVAAFVSAALSLTQTPSRYGFDVDLVALNAYGDQSTADLSKAFAQREDVAAATAFTAASLLIDGRAVPGLAATPVKREAVPTRLAGRAPINAWEVALGRDTLDALGAGIGDEVDVQVLTAPDAEARRPVRMEIVGVVTFPPVSQIGTDMPRLGTGALVTRGSLVRMGFPPSEGPEFTAVRMEPGGDPRDVIAANPDGFRDRARTTTVWFEDAKPAELRQLIAAMPYLRGALAVAYAVLVAVIAHALWSLTRSNRHDLAVLRVVGYTRRQLDVTAVWQVVPFLLGAVVVGIPVGTVVGRLAYRAFARSLAVVDVAPSSWPGLVALVVGVAIAAAVAAVVAIVSARRTRTAPALRES